jgi:hypothetical protein
MSYNFQADNDNATPKQEHSMGSLLFSAFLSGADTLSTVDTALDTLEAVGEIRSERFQAEAKRQGNMPLEAQQTMGGAFQNSAEGATGLFENKPQSRYLNYNFGYKRKPGMAMGMAA